MRAGVGGRDAAGRVEHVDLQAFCAHVATQMGAFMSHWHGGRCIRLRGVSVASCVASLVLPVLPTLWPAGCALVLTRLAV